jgi:hypothetical protein
MTDDPPVSWSEMLLTRPADEAPAGSVLNVQSGRVVVRSYDTFRAHSINVLGDPDNRYAIDTAYVPMLEGHSNPVVGDILFYLGEVDGDDAINLWMPTRVIWVGGEHDSQVSVRTISDSWVGDKYINEACVPLHLLSDSERNTVTELAMSLQPATVQQARELMAIFGCEWLVSASIQGD